MMNSREKTLLASLAVLVCVIGGYLLFDKYGPRSAAPVAPSALMRHRAPPFFHRPTPPAFSKDQIKTFLAAVREAEKQPDPAHRCLVYPDPPGSHWTHDAVIAYCHYRFQPTVTFAEVKGLVEHGKTLELDRRMDEALQAQLTQPDAHGRLDHIFISDFDNGSFAIRPILDAWKRQSPNSAYAYAASGYAYVEMAHAERGGASARDTAQDHMNSMQRLLAEADVDLRHAITINPRITPVYVAMIHAAGLSLGGAYAKRAIAMGLHADPSNWSIYHELMWLTRPEWMGSLDTMQGVGAAAMKHADENPLLVMEKFAVQRYEANPDGCDCAPPPQAANFPKAFDELAISSSLVGAGETAAKQGISSVAVVYLSEALRFQPQLDALRRERAPQLAAVGESPMALDEANRLIAADLKNPDNYVMRGNVYSYTADNRRAEQDFEAALALSPDDIDALAPLGDLYTNDTHEWDKAWDVADRIIRKYPNSPGGWVMRATIQENQPRAGLGDTYRYFVRQFGNDPSMQWQIGYMRQILARASQGGSAGTISATH